MTDIYGQRTPKERFRRSVWATFICWIAIVFFAYGMPLLGFAANNDKLAAWVALTGVIWVPVTIWFLKRKMCRELAGEERDNDA
ncbi:MAG: hypothetical protein AAF557_15900 [Pseudomonadota bacterium]